MPFRISKLAFLNKTDCTEAKLYEKEKSFRDTLSYYTFKNYLHPANHNLFYKINARITLHSLCIVAKNHLFRNRFESKWTLFVPD